MVPASFGCSFSVLAAIAMLAPSRAARSAIASPMPRDAPVMNRVFPASGKTISLLTRHEGGKRGARLVRLQPFLEVHGFGIHSLDQVVKVAAQELSGERHRYPLAARRSHAPPA